MQKMEAGRSDNQHAETRSISAGLAGHSDQLGNMPEGNTKQNQHEHLSLKLSKL